MITAIIIAKNEEKNIKDCLNSVKWCDEIIVVDDKSIDKTAIISRNFGAKVYTHPMKGNFSEQRNFGLSKANGDWILFIDADERVTEALWFEIMQYVNSALSDAKGFYVKRRDIMWGKALNYGETGFVKLLRLAQKNCGIWEGLVHEKWNIKGKKVVLSNYLEHYPHDDIKNFLKEVNYYTDLRARDLFDRKISSPWIFIMLYPVAKFIKNYFLMQGIRDGVPGLLNALMMSFHSFLVRAKLWLLYHST